MEKKDLIGLLNEIFVTLGYHRKGNNWVANKDEISKLVNLQKSDYSNRFYVNYGYIIKGLDLTTGTHFLTGLGSKDAKENEKIKSLLNLENNILPDYRTKELRKIIIKNIIAEMQLINTQSDLLNFLLGRPHLNDVPLIVKNHFNLKE